MLINIECQRHRWHAGAGIDSEPIWNSYINLLEECKNVFGENFVQKVVQDKTKKNELVWNEATDEVKKDTIKKITRIHLESGGLFFRQCVTAVGWIGGTVPEMFEDQGIVELPTSDSSNSAIVCSAALAGKDQFILSVIKDLWLTTQQLLSIMQPRVWRCGVCLARYSLGLLAWKVA